MSDKVVLTLQDKEFLSKLPLTEGQLKELMIWASECNPNDIEMEKLKEEKKQLHEEISVLEELIREQ